MTAAGAIDGAQALVRRLSTGTSLELRRLRHQLSLLGRWWLAGHRPFTPLLVLATHNSGGNLLLSHLVSLPGVSCLAEVLSPALQIGPRRCDLNRRQCLEHLRFSLQSLHTPVRACLLRLDQLLGSGVTPADLSRAFSGAKFVILYRQSLAEQIASCRLTHEGQARIVALDPLEVRCYCQTIREMYQRVLADPTLRGCTSLVTYEELRADPRGVFCERICPLLGLPASAPRAPERATLAVTPQPLVERIANFHQLASLLASPHCRQQYDWPSLETASGRAA